MQYKQLGNSDLQVSEICLGTMTFGQQNTIAEAHQQLDYAIGQGVNFIDTAEMYPVPPRAETQGATEEFIGHWLVRHPRDRLVIATKIAGPNRGFKWIRGGNLYIDRQNLQQAVEASLQRLQTDYIDLYQIHWPDRYVPLFGRTQYDPTQERETVPIVEQLTALAELIQAGKIRYVGLSNETPWGMAQFCQIARQMNLPQVITIQNAYNLLNRVFESALAEVCHHEKIGLLAYSPLGFGMLTGKYCQAPAPQSRLTLFPGFGQRYHKPNVAEAAAEYAAIAHRHGLKPSVLALAFVKSRWFVSSVLVGATTLEQLQENLSSVEVSLNEAILAEIETVHHRYPNPAP
ncbi:MAG: NADP(H)-dependent aldo-keto reductase [Leptolyngbyaceae cyanobacterium bins.59]|nr:NADP(H)-dependent aldo-keto reductase [Leptolyngbyaceae cyanobacterium bins.59]